MTTEEKADVELGRPGGAKANEAASPAWSDVLRRVITGIGLVLSPAIGALAARAAPMAVGLQTRWTMIDPTFYTAYSQHPADLMKRFGGADYYWVRLGFILPAAAFHAVLGAIPGFIAFRYTLALLAVIASYVACQRIASKGAAWLCVTAIVTNPVILTAWGSDYPDSAAVAYLVAAAALLSLRGRTSRLRLVLRVSGGVLLGLALNAHVATLPFAAALVTAIPIARRGRERWSDVLLVVVGIVGITGALATFSWAAWGHVDIVTPSVDQYLRLRRPEQMAMWHSTGWGWLQRPTYLIVPPFLLFTWLVSLRLTPRRALGSSERLLVVAATLSFAFAAWSQASGGASLEYFLYSSLLWWSVGYLVALIAWRFSGAAIIWRSQATYWTSAALLAITTAVAWFRVPVPRFTIWPVGIGVAIVVLGLVTVLILWIGRSERGPWVGAGAVLIVLVAAVTFTIGEPRIAFAPGQATYPLVDYSALGQSNTALVRDVYEVVSEVPSVVPPSSKPGELVITWVPPHGFPGPPLDPVSQGAAQYPASRLSSTMPRLESVDGQRLDRLPPGTCLLLLSSSGDEFPAAESALTRWRPSVVRRAALSSGAETLHVEVVQINRR